MLFFVETTIEAQAPTLSSFPPVSGYQGTLVTSHCRNLSITHTNNIVRFGVVKANVTAAAPDSSLQLVLANYMELIKRIAC